eukprot:CAMPEP_0197184122 /NCGR_PEP_ID=MMETSP1423-20130617/9239_1 /TAXON_ID=476441 /ORGANISM="Pseudo-nitzschia heimii, Strain UNC1101" /LENGTH=68 /DNA_ID=CAMNT_0042634863 /DNA_START=359 /DNA_END=562 /DNA_ORIENTATION=+
MEDDLWDEDEAERVDGEDACKGHAHEGVDVWIIPNEVAHRYQKDYGQQDDQQRMRNVRALRELGGQVP